MSGLHRDFQQHGSGADSHVCCGLGRELQRLAPLVGPEGRVAGIDISPATQGGTLTPDEADAWWHSLEDAAESFFLANVGFIAVGRKR